MSMRIEGHALLWGIAAVSVVAALLLPRIHPVIGHQTLPQSGDAANIGYVASEEDSASAFPRTLPALPTGGRSLFPPTLQIANVAEPNLPNQPTPILKGLISDGEVVRAVFATSSDVSAVVTAGVADAVADFLVSAIEADNVTLTAPDGATIVLTLRGPGEMP